MSNAIASPVKLIMRNELASLIEINAGGNMRNDFVACHRDMTVRLYE